MSKSKRAQSIKARSASKIRSKAATRTSAARDRTRSSPLPKSPDVTMVLDEGSVKELSAAPPPSWDRVPVTEAIVKVSSIRDRNAVFGRCHRRRSVPRGVPAHTTDLR